MTSEPEKKTIEEKDAIRANNVQKEQQRLLSCDITELDAIYLLSEHIPGKGAVPGSVAALASVVENASTVDPDGVGPFLYFLCLDMLQCYGSNIHILFSRVCQSNPTYFMAVLRAFQGGKITKEDVMETVRDKNKLLDVKATLATVQQWLPAFARV